jgi:LmbE family N-acetylglucosaminyl deacetylase
MAPPVHALYLSPHLDDAVLSCGGQLHALARSGRHALVATVMAGDAPEDLSPLGAELHRIWAPHLGAAGVMDGRRREDAEACAALGVDREHMDVSDALYRRDPSTGAPLYPTLGSLFARPRPEDDALVDEVAERLAALPAAERVVAPLGAGRHVDHLLVRRAAERVFGRGRLELYEDYPYARERWVLAKALGLPWRWRSRLLTLDEAALAAKCRAIACYRSQLVTAFADRDDMERQVRAFAARVGGERLWRHRSSP